MITSSVRILGACFLVCFLICSITPISALEMGSIKNNNITPSLINDKKIETSDNFIPEELNGLYHLNKVHWHDNPPDDEIISYGVSLILITIASILRIILVFL